MKQIRFFHIIALAILLLTGQQAFATTKTVKYHITSVTNNGSSYTLNFGLADGSDTPFEGFSASSVTVNPSAATDQTVTLGDGFSLRLQWAAGSNVIINNSDDGWNINVPGTGGGYVTYTVACSSDQFFVNSFRPKTNSGSTGMSDTEKKPIMPDFNYAYHMEQSYNSKQPFGRLEVTYTDAPPISLLTSPSDNTYNITSTLDLVVLAGYVNNGGNTCSGLTFLQTNDITYSPTTAWNNSSSTENNYTAIGTEDHNFQGTFDGQNHTISGIRIYKVGANNDGQGLFGAIGSGGTVRGVNLADARITGRLSVGGIVGHLFSATVEDCTVAANVCIHAVQSYSYYHGGIVGFNQGTVRRCVSRARLTVADGKTDCQDYGAIVGRNNYVEVKDCIAIGAIVPNVTRAGAIIGDNNGSSTVVQRNYYRACTVAGVANATGVGVGFESSNNSPHDVTDNQGALALYSLTLPSGVSLVRTKSATLPGTGNATYTTGADIDGTPYAYDGSTVTLNYTGDIPEGSIQRYVVTKTSDGSDVTADVLSGTTLTMPSYDVTVSAVMYAPGESESNPFVVTTWADLQEKMAEGGYIRLDDDVTDPDKTSNSGLIVPGGKTVTLDLNGHTIDRGLTKVISGGEVIYVKGKLTLNDSGTGGNITGGYEINGGGVSVAFWATFTMNGGTITGNNSNHGGGVNVSYDATFTMNGGTIRDNTANYGGGVYLSPNNGNNTFTMNGGTIRDNTANYGGGVYIDSGTIHVSGSPVITGNTNAAGKEENVYLKEEQSINIDEHLSTGASIGVTRADAPNVSDNCDPIVIATGATDGDSQYFHSDMTGYTIEAGQGEQADKLLLVTPASTPWSELKEQLVAGNDVSLTDDVTALECDGGYPEISQTVTLDLNGHNITVNENSDNVIFIDENGNFTLTGSGTISGSKEYAVNVYFSTSMFTMNGGTISGGTGGGVNVNKGTFNVLGSPVITGNTKDGNACNVYLNQPKNNEQCIIHVTGPLSADARIGVTTKTVPTGESRVTFAQGSGNYTLTAADASRFSSDASEYFVGYDNLNHVAYLTVNPNDAGIVDITLTGAPNSGFYWATFYNHNWRFTLPEGAAAYTMDSDKHLYRLGDNGRTIPADKAVVIISDKQDITLTLDDGNATIADHSGGNILRGNNSAVAVSDLSGTPYVLSLDGSTIGFRQFTGDAIPAHKAYYLQ